MRSASPSTGLSRQTREGSQGTEGVDGSDFAQLWGLRQVRREGVYHKGQGPGSVLASISVTPSIRVPQLPPMTKSMQ